MASESGSTCLKPDRGLPGPTVKYSAVHVKRDGKWLISNLTESRYVPQSTELYLDELAWLIGDWKGAADGKTISLQCQWLPGKSFLSRRYTINEDGNEVSSGIQLIGWDPLLEKIVSWTFNSDGSFGHEIWNQEGNRWQADAASTLSNGSTSLARNILVKLNDNAFTWRSVDRSLNDQLLPDTVEVRIHREVSKVAR